jgi:hypothetical protein
MRRSVAIALAVSAALVVATAAGASTKFASTEEITAAGSLVVTFDEGSQKRFPAVEYRLDASALLIIDVDADLQFRVVYSPSASVTLIPDSKGRATGALTLDIDQSGQCQLFRCGTLRYIEYFDIKVTNLTTGKSYPLDNIHQGEPPA